MSELNLNLDDETRAFIEKQAAQGGFATPEDYVRELISKEELRIAGEELDAMLLEGLNSEGVELTEEVLKSIRDEALSKIKAKKVA